MAPEMLIEPDSILPNREYLEFFDSVIARLVLVADARAKLEERDENDETLEWVNVAKEGMQRVSRLGEVPGMRGIEKARLFASGQEDLQRELYVNMCERRDGDEPLELTLLAYAKQVAYGEIFV
ncbi:hypothetical protein COY17_03410 [Candidatus Saccharibacteria bacterium CG_4_10_14_0_2_um_filter_52_9]|nr:MAG: hypothetical protein COY17_03410 [Candidatus Saccharibacteria bacterium CG_4_10_14_0_2_um_filter_52_9]